MAIHVLKNAEIWIGDTRLKGFMNQVALSSDVTLVDALAFFDTGMRRIAGQENNALGASGFYDSVIDGENFGRRGTANVPVGVSVPGADGDIAYFMRAVLGEYELGASVGDAFPFTMNAMGSDGGPFVRGSILHNATRTATGTGTGRQIGAVSAAQKVYAALFVLAASGTTPTLNVTIESDDNSGFTTATTRMTFTQQIAKASEWHIPLAGAIGDDWWRIQYTIAGGGPSFEFVVLAGIT